MFVFAQLFSVALWQLDGLVVKCSPVLMMVFFVDFHHSTIPPKGMTVGIILGAIPQKNLSSQLTHCQLTMKQTESSF